MSQDQKTPDQAGPEENFDRRTLFVRSVPLSASSDELSEFFSQFVPVKHAVIVTDENKKSRGFGFVSFTEDEDALTALVEAKTNRFKNQLLRVDVAKRRDRKNKKDEGSTSEKKPAREIELVDKRRSRIIIKNLPWSCKDSQKLKNIFNKFGTVTDAYIPMKKGGLMKGFAFVVMRKHAAAEKAVAESQDLKIDGRQVQVSLAMEKSKWEKQQQEEQKTEKRAIETEEESKEESENEEDEEKESDNEDGDEEEDNENDDEDEEVENQEDNEFEDLNDHDKANKQEAFSVFVRNIPYDADAETLKEHFLQFGPVKYALPVIDKVTGVARGSAFVAFSSHDAYTKCLSDAPEASSTSMLISDDVAPEYVYQGRILLITPTVDRDLASKLADRNSAKRKEAFGKAPGEKDRRNLFLLNEGRITENSKLASVVTPVDMELRAKSYNLRVQQLNKNASLHLSLTRLAIRNLPRAMLSKAFKAMGRKAVVQFATEVKNGARQPLSKEEVSRSIKLKHEDDDKVTADPPEKKSKKGVVRQAKVVMEVKGTGDVGRSRGYGFLEFRDHKAALMALRWLNAHEVTKEEITEGLTDEEIKALPADGPTRRRLIAEFAIENAQVVRRRKEKVILARNKRSRDDESGGDRKRGRKEGDNKTQPATEQAAGPTKTDETTRRMIGKKRKMKKRSG